MPNKYILKQWNQNTYITWLHNLTCDVSSQLQCGWCTVEEAFFFNANVLVVEQCAWRNSTKSTEVILSCLVLFLACAKRYQITHSFNFRAQAAFPLNQTHTRCHENKHRSTDTKSCSFFGQGRGGDPMSELRSATLMWRRKEEDQTPNVDSDSKPARTFRFFRAKQTPPVVVPSIHTKVWSLMTSVYKPVPNSTPRTLGTYPGVQKG